MKIQLIEISLKLYKKDQGKYPQGASALNTLTKPWTDKEGNQQSDYFAKYGVDLWGHPYNYEFPSPMFPDGSRPAIWSNGPNGKNEQGGGDDVNNWNAE